MVLAGFDADGDGHDDILTRAGSQQLVIRYGPFAPGPLPSFADGEVPDDQVTVLGEPFCDVDFAVTRIPDLLGPGRDVVAHGGSTTCPYGFVMYELLQPRGLRLPVPVSQVRADIEDSWRFDTVGDPDSDGHVDFLLTRYGGGDIGWSVPGPLRSTYDSNDLYGMPSTMQLQRGDWVRWSIGDLNADARRLHPPTRRRLLGHLVLAARRSHGPRADHKTWSPASNTPKASRERTSPISIRNSSIPARS